MSCHPACPPIQLEILTGKGGYANTAPIFVPLQVGPHVPFPPPRLPPRSGLHPLVLPGSTSTPPPPPPPAQPPTAGGRRPREPNRHPENRGGTRRGSRAKCSSSSRTWSRDPDRASRTSPTPSASPTPPPGAPGRTTAAPPRYFALAPSAPPASRPGVGRLDPP